MSLTPNMSQRVSFFLACLSPLSTAILAVYTLLGFITWVRDELLDERWKIYHVIDFLPSWPLYLWLAIGFFVVVIALSEGLFRQHRLMEEARSHHKPLIDLQGNPYSSSSQKGISRFAVPIVIVGGLAGAYFLIPHHESTRTAPTTHKLQTFTFEEKVEPAPDVKPIPHKATPSIIKKDIPVEPKEPLSFKPRETISAVLIRKCPALPQAIDINAWVQRINSVRIDRQERDLRPDLQAVIRHIGRPPSHGLTVKEFVDDAVAEATFTLRCLGSEGYILITETTTQGRWYAVDFPNLEFEFVPERLNEFIEGL